MNARLRSALAAIAIVAWFYVIAHALFAGSDARLTLQNLGHLPEILTHVPRNVGYVFPVLAFVFSGLGAGDLICAALGVRPSNPWGRVAFALCLGQVCWLAVVVAVGMPGFLTQPVLGALFAAGLLSSIWRSYAARDQWRGKNDAPPQAAPAWTRYALVLCVALLAFDLYLALLGALMPETGFDARFYHLAEAKRYADHGALFNLAASQHSVEMALPQNQEILYAAVVKLFGLPAAKILSWSNLLLATFAIVGFACEFFASKAAGTLASLLFVSTPVVTLTATTASNDLSQAPYVLLALYAFFAWTRDRERIGWLAAAGLLCGFAFGIKPFALFTAVILGAFVAAYAFRRPLRPLAAFGVACLLGALPDFIRETAVTGDPFFPIGAAWFHSAFWWPAQEQAMRDSIRVFGANTSWAVFPKLPWVLTMESNHYRNALGPMFLFVAPIAAIYAAWPKAQPVFRALTVFLALWIALWFSTQYVEARYAESLMPAIALLAAFLAIPSPAAMLAGSARAAYAGALAVVALANTPLLVPMQSYSTLPWVMGTVRYDWAYLYHGRPEREVQLAYAPMIEYINAHLDARKDKVYVDGVDMYYNLYSDIDLFDGVAGRDEGFLTWNLTSPDAYARLHANGVDYVAFPERSEAGIRLSPLYEHLEKVVKLPPGPLENDSLGQARFLYRIVDRASHPQSIAEPGFYRHDNDPSVYRLTKNRTYCVVISMQQLAEYGATNDVSVVSPQTNFLRGYRPLGAQLGCPPLQSAR